MKIAALLCTVLSLSLSTLAQQTINGSIVHDGMQRDYVIYIPANYTGDTEVPLLFNFHGYGSSAEEQMWYGDFRSIADTAGFLVVHPQGSLFNGISHWNVGGWTIGSTVDDVGFAEALLDSLSADYNINLNRIYATGMSNGGYMSFLLACQLSDKIAAIASVTGSMTPETYIQCLPTHPTPILQMHGTTDLVVPYNGAVWSESITAVIEYWVDYNNCNNQPTIINLPDLDPHDGSTVEHYIYTDGDNNVNTEHFKITGGGHTWPGSIFGGNGTNYDIDASTEIWKFLLEYQLNSTTAIDKAGENLSCLNIYPNPTQSHITIDIVVNDPVHYAIYSSMGERVMSGQLLHSNQKIDLSHLSTGIYIVKTSNDHGFIHKTH